MTFALIAVTAALLPAASRAANPQPVSILFDLVKVTGAAWAGQIGGVNITEALSVQSIGAGPFQTTDGKGPLNFLNILANGDEDFVTEFTGAGIVANQFNLRYFGSVAAAKGSILRNVTQTGRFVV